MYSSQVLVQAQLGRELTTNEILLLNPIASAVDKFINSETGRVFEETLSTARYFDGNSSRELYIDDATVITEVAEYDAEDQTSTIIAPAEYITRPYNTLPISSIEFVSGNFFARGTKNIKITGKWGYCAKAPDDIKAVASFLVAQCYLNPENLKQESIEGYSRVFSELLPPIYMNILNNMVKVSI